MIPPWVIILLVFFVLMDGLIIYRTLRFKSSLFPEMKKRHELDEARVYESLSKMIQFETVSYRDVSQINQKAFTEFRSFLKERYPKVFEVATYSMHEGALLFHIKGESDEEPLVLMAHYDVVPVEGEWIHPPFSGHIDETHIYGRGAIDTKNSLCAILEATEFLLNQDKQFKHDVYLAFGADEETNGISAVAIVNYFKEKNIKPFMVLDEGGAVVSNIFPGVKQKAAVVGIAEKGFLNVELVGHSKGGHASTPPKDQVITNLAKVVLLLHNKPIFKLKMTSAARALFDTIAPYSKSFVIKMFFANLWFFMPVVKLIAKKSGGEFLSLFKTTQAFTMADGSQAINVLPTSASIGVNYRLRPEETSQQVIDKISKIAGKYNVEVKVLDVHEASTSSLLDDRFKVLKKAILETFTDAIPTPYLMVATTDSRHYHEICENVYKFSPMDVSRDDLKLIHGIGEKISKQNMLDGTYFYINLLEQF